MALRSSRTIDANAAADHIGRWMIDYIDRSGLDGWVVGVSGGIDSAVTSTLAARTGRPTTVLRMPIHQAADQDQRGADHIAAGVRDDKAFVVDRRRFRRPVR